MYLMMARTIYYSQQTASNESAAKKRKRIFWKLVGYPIIFFCVFCPLGINRLVSVINPSIPFPNDYVAFAICIFSSNGFFNAMFHGYTRKVFSKALATLSKSQSESTSTSP